MADKFEIQTEPTEEPKGIDRSLSGGASRAVGPVARGLSQALMQGAFEKFGHAFTDTGDVRRDAETEASRLQPWREQGQKAAGALELRWHTMEYENFQASAVEPYIEAKKGMLEKYKQLHADLDSGIWAGPPGPDGQPQMQQIDITDPGGREQLIRLRGQIEKDFYGRNSDMDIELFNLAHKYPGNPLISKRIEMIATAYSDQLMKVTNPQQTLQAEGAQSEITARMMNEDTKRLQAKATLKNAGTKLKEPTDLRQAAAHPDIGPGKLMDWLVDSVGGEAIMFGSRGGDAMRLARSSYEQKLISEDSTLAKQPDKLALKLEEQEGNIRALAASIYLKKKNPAAWAASREATPHHFAFEKVGDNPDGILSDDDERGYTGKVRLSQERKEELFTSWKELWRKELDNWASDPSNPADPDRAMDHMEVWIKDAIINGAPGVPNYLTISVNANTKEVRIDLLDRLIEDGKRTVMENTHIRQANPGKGILHSIASPFGTSRRGGRFGRAQRREQRRKGLLEEDN